RRMTLLPNASLGGGRPATWVSTMVASLGQQDKSRERRRRQIFTALPRPIWEGYLLKTLFFTQSVVATAPHEFGGGHPSQDGKAQVGLDLLGALEGGVEELQHKGDPDPDKNAQKACHRYPQPLTGF